jgi:hypothetical protein
VDALGRVENDLLVARQVGVAASAVIARFSACGMWYSAYSFAASQIDQAEVLPAGDDPVGELVGGYVVDLPFDDRRQLSLVDRHDLAACGVPITSAPRPSARAKSASF